MQDNKRIIDEYHNADFEKRLYFFLSYRELRDEFLEIDQSDTSVGFSAHDFRDAPKIISFLGCGIWPR